MCQPTTSSRAEYKILIWMLKNLLIINTQSFYFIWWQTKKASVSSFLLLKNVHLSPPFRRCVETFVSLRGHKLESSPQRLDLPKTRKIPGFGRAKRVCIAASQQMIPPPLLQTDEHTKDFNASSVVKKPDIYRVVLFTGPAQKSSKCWGWQIPTKKVKVRVKT